MQSVGGFVVLAWTCFLVVALCLVPGQVEASLGFPAPLKRCKWQDEACFVTQANAYIRAFRRGIPERKVPGLDPINMGSMQIESGGHSDSLQFKVVMTDCQLYSQPHSVVVKSLKGFTKNLGGKPLKLMLQMEASDLEVRAQYDVNGKLLILPIVSTGSVVIKLKDVHSKSRILAEPVKRKDGLTYLNITDFKTVTKLKSGSFNLTNLFNGNVELRESTLKVLNDEWDALAADIQPAINDASSRAFKTILQGLWNDIPYEEFFEAE